MTEFSDEQIADRLDKATSGGSFNEVVMAAQAASKRLRLRASEARAAPSPEASATGAELLTDEQIEIASRSMGSKSSAKIFIEGARWARSRLATPTSAPVQAERPK